MKYSTETGREYDNIFHNRPFNSVLTTETNSKGHMLKERCKNRVSISQITKQEEQERVYREQK